MPECPTCDKTLSTARGVKVHHAKIHDESIAGDLHTCDWCGDEFRQTADCKGRFCSRGCYAEWQSENQTGTEHPAWRESVELTCEWCGGIFTVNPCREDSARFCSKTCAENSPRPSGTDHPNWKEYATIECDYCGGLFDVPPAREETARFCSKSCQHNSGRVEKVCENCNNTYTVKKSHADDRVHCSRECQIENQSSQANPLDDHIERPTAQCVEVDCTYCGLSFERPDYHPEVTNAFCSEGCHNEWQRERGPTGPEHWNWKGGKSLYEALRRGLGPYRRERRAAREEVDECASCGDVPDGGNLHCHHIIPLLAGGCNDSELFMMLCNSCHMTAEAYTWSIPEVESIIPDRQGRRGGDSAQTVDATGD